MPDLAGVLKGHRVAVLAADGVERVEQPGQALKGAGVPEVAVPLG